MQNIHDDKPPLSHGTASLWVDLVFWKPNQKDARKLTEFLEEYGLGERSQTVEWLDKITVRLAMWKGRYWYFLSDEEWQEAAPNMIEFIKKTAAYYHCRKVEYDTRAFAVGLIKKVRKEHRSVEQLTTQPPAKDHPVWWIFSL